MPLRSVQSLRSPFLSEGDGRAEGAVEMHCLGEYIHLTAE